MNLKEQLAAKLARVAELKAIDGDFTDEQVEEIATLGKDIDGLRDRIAKNEAAAKAIAELGAGAEDPDDDEGDDDEPAGKSGRQLDHVRDREVKSLDFGSAFIKSDAYKAFLKQNPSGLGNGSIVNIGKSRVGSLDEWFVGRKATLGSPVARIQPIRMPTVDLVDRNRLTFLDLISRGRTGGNFEYVQITGVTRNAAIVPESTGPADAAALKPMSDMTTALADAKVFTYADGYDVTNQLLSDGPAFASYMNSELEYSLDNVVEDYLLNGTGASGQPRGILNTSGVQGKTYVATAVDDAAAMNFIKASRLAIRDIVRLPGGVVDAIVLSPEMDAAIDLLQDGNDRFYGQGPFGMGPNTLWGRPRVTSERLTDTTAILGDFKQVALLDREGLSIQAFNQHADYARRNMVYVRAELRAAQAIWKPNRLSVLTAVAE